MWQESSKAEEQHWEKMKENGFKTGSSLWG